MTALLSILLPLVGILALLGILGALQTAGERMQRAGTPFARSFGKALAVTAMIGAALVSIVVVIRVGQLLMQPSSIEPTACARFCD